jgi:hypothetical protein
VVAAACSPNTAACTLQTLHSYDARRQAVALNEQSVVPLNLSRPKSSCTGQNSNITSCIFVRQTTTRTAPLDRIARWSTGRASGRDNVNSWSGSLRTHQNSASWHVPAHQIVADGDILFVTYDEVEDVDPERIFRCEVSIRDVRQKDVIFIINPEPEWERDDAGELEEFIVNLNARTPQQREGQPSAWAHPRTALEEKCAALAAHARPDPALGTPQWTTKF